MSKKEIVPFQFDGSDIRVVMKGSEPWFVAADVCKVLDHTNTSVATSRLDDDERGVSTVYTPGGNQRVAIVSESGLYSLVFTSRKEEAKRFRKWIASEVLPSIRKDGGYISPNASGAQLKKLRARLNGIDVRNAFTQTLQDHGVHGAGYAMCTDAINKPVLGGTAALVKQKMGLPVKASIRDNLPHKLLAALSLAEAMADEQIEKKDSQGNCACVAECDTAAQKVAGIL